MLVLAASLGMSCAPGSGSPSEPPIVDTAAVEQLVQNALAEVDRLAASPPSLDLPPELAGLLADNGIQLPPVPTNAAQICEALGTPGVATAAGAGLGAIVEGLATGGQIAGLLVTVIFSTCPVWSPHLETLLRDLG
ncbi:MAG TPA: hypothetical protein VMP67_12155 [Candidatus Limnocylindria bacterium]|nr:hypothetical protein [Candidatus Limnocylindria bacterium]